MQDEEDTAVAGLVSRFAKVTQPVCRLQPTLGNLRHKRCASGLTQLRKVL